MQKNSKIFVAGHNGMVGSAIVRNLKENGYTNLVLKSRKELDLKRKDDVKSFFEKERPQFVFLAAAKVGGIKANMGSPVEFLIDNMEIQINVIEQSYLAGVEKILILGSSCIYPRECPQPMKEEYLLTGPLESTNEGYSLSKIMALRLGEYYFKQYGFQAVSIMPPNLYGPNDSFDLEKSHVLSALVRRFHEAKNQGLNEITLWGTGNARREFMHVNDLAKAAYYYMEHGEPGHFLNVGWGTDVSIKELAEMVADVTGFKGKICWDHSKPDGMMCKCLDVTRMKETGFKPEISLRTGVQEMLNYYLQLKAEGAIL